MCTGCGAGLGPGSPDESRLCKNPARCFMTIQSDATLARLAAAGHRVIDHVGRPGSRRARIGFVHPASLGGLLLHFVERDEL